MNIRNEITIGTREDHTRIEDDGHLSMNGRAGVWDDLRFPASAINPVGLTGAAGEDNSSTFLGTLLFDSALVEICCGQAQFPHSRKLGSTIRPHIHWSPTSTGGGNVLWQLDYQVANINGTFPGSYTTVQILVAAGTVANKHILSSFGDIVTSGGLSMMMLWKISRIASDVTDTYGADARLLEFDIHYEIDSIGSREKMLK